MSGSLSSGSPFSISPNSTHSPSSSRSSSNSPLSPKSPIHNFHNNSADNPINAIPTSPPDHRLSPREIEKFEIANIEDLGPHKHSHTHNSASSPNNLINSSSCNSLSPSNSHEKFPSSTKDDTEEESILDTIALQILHSNDKKNTGSTRNDPASFVYNRDSNISNGSPGGITNHGQVNNNAPIDTPSDSGIPPIEDKYEDQLLTATSNASSSSSFDEFRFGPSSQTSSSTASSHHSSNHNPIEYKITYQFLKNEYRFDQFISDFNKNVKIDNFHTNYLASNSGVNSFTNDLPNRNDQPKRFKVDGIQLEDVLHNYNESINKTEIADFDNSKFFQAIDIELSDWFTSGELSKIKNYRDTFSKNTNGINFLDFPIIKQDKYIKKLIQKWSELNKDDKYDNDIFNDTENNLLLKNSILLCNSNEIIFNNLTTISAELQLLQQFTYLIMGNFGFVQDSKQQLENMKLIIYKFIKMNYLNVLFKYLKKMANVVTLLDLNNVHVDKRYLNSNGINGNDNLKIFSENLKVVMEYWFLLLTNCYIILSIVLEISSDTEECQYSTFKECKSKLLKELESFRILPFFLKYIEKWKVKSVSNKNNNNDDKNSSNAPSEGSNNTVLMRLRNVILVVNKLIMVEFGNDSELKDTKHYLSEKFKLFTKDDLKEESDEKEKVESSHNSEKKQTHAEKLIASPLDYYVYSKDIASRYPTFSPTISSERKNIPDYPLSLDNNSSLSQFIEVPRTLDIQSQNVNLPVPYSHIATPAPSPSASPSRSFKSTGYFDDDGFLDPEINNTSSSYSATFNNLNGANNGSNNNGTGGNGLLNGNNGGKIKRSFQTNLAFPFVNSSSSIETDNTDKDSCAPKSIMEANNLFSGSVVESFSKRQLWDERFKFMNQERGWKSYINKDEDGYTSEKTTEKVIESDQDIFDIDLEKELKLFPQYKDEIYKLHKLESYYMEFFPCLSSIANVFIDMFSSNTGIEEILFNEKRISKAQKEKAPNQSSSHSEYESVFISSLELLNKKEVVLKNYSSLMNLLMRWLRVSHVLKCENLTTILFDGGFTKAFLDYLTKYTNATSSNNTGNSNANSSNSSNSNSNSSNEPGGIFFNVKMFNDEIRVLKYDFFTYCVNLSYIKKSEKESSNVSEKDETSCNYYFYNNFLNSDSEITLKAQRAKQLKQYQLEAGTNTNNGDNNTTSGTYDLDNIDESKVYDTSGKTFNYRFLIILNSNFKILQKILLGKTRRLISFSERQAAKQLRVILNTFYEPAVYKSILKILKEIIALNGKKWKSINMDLVSLVYLHLKLKLKDHWLSGRDIESELGDQEGQELAMRALVQFYTARKYQLESFGYERRNSDFFGRETDLIASNELNNEQLQQE